MNTVLVHKVDAHRRLCIKKDLREVELWMLSVESANEELNHFSIIEKHLVKNTAVANNLKNIRRKNILMMATLCKYEQELKIEYEYGKEVYDENRLKHHEKKREHYLHLINEYSKFKISFLNILKTYRRR